MPDSTCRTIKAQYRNASGANFMRQGSMGATAILEIMEEPKIMQIGSYVPNSMCAGKAVSSDGIAPTVMENHGMPTAVVEPAVMSPIRTEEQRQLRKQGVDTFSGRQMLPRTDGVSNTITTVQKDILLQEPIKIRQATAQGYAECPARGGFDAAYPNSRLRRGRVQDNGDVVGAITASADGHCVYEGAEVSILGYTRDDKGNVTSRHEKEVAGTLHTSTGSGGNTDQFVKEQDIVSMQANAMRGSIDGVSPCLTEAMGMGGGQISMITEFQKQQYEQTNKRRVYSISDETDTREILSILWKEVGEEAFQKTLRRLSSILEKEILRLAVYEDGVCEDRTNISELERSSCVSTEDSIPNRGSSESLWDLRLNTKCGYTPQGWQPSEQYLRELDACLSELSHEATQAQECVQNLRQSLQNNPWYVRQALSQMEEIRRPLSQAVEFLPKVRYRVRKLTPRECFRLQDVDDSDIDKIEAHRIKVTLKNGTVKEKPIPKSRKYMLAGNSIVVSCLYHIFHQMFIAEPPEPKPIQKSLFDL